MAFFANLCVATIILGAAAGCEIPSMYHGEWEGRWDTLSYGSSSTTVTANNWANFVCSDIHNYADEPEAKTILLKDPCCKHSDNCGICPITTPFGRPIRHAYCYYCLFVRKVNADQLQIYIRDTICSSSGDPSVSYSCQLPKPSSRHLTTLNRKQSSKKRDYSGFWWN